MEAKDTEMREEEPKTILLQPCLDDQERKRGPPDAPTLAVNAAASNEAAGTEVGDDEMSSQPQPESTVPSANGDRVHHPAPYSSKPKAPSGAVDSTPGTFHGPMCPPDYLMKQVEAQHME